MSANAGTSHALGARLLLVVGLAAGLAAPGRAIEELAATERQQQLAALRLPTMALERHLLAEQRLVVWLPPGFVEATTIGPGPLRLRRETDGTELRLARAASQPGASILQLAERTVDQLREDGELGELRSVRRLRIASLPAVELVAVKPLGDGEREMRIAVVAGPEGDFHRVVLLAREANGGEPLDVLWSVLLRDFAPLDHGVWTAAFERLRRGLVADATASATWDDRNRLLAEISQPEAVGQAWVGERLASLSARGPALLVDGLLHVHPRVRIAVVSALDLDAIPEPARARLLACVARDADPAVRYRLASRLLAVPGLAAAVLERVLDEDSALARSAALQLLALLPAGERGAVTLRAFARRDQLPADTAAFLATLLARWGPSPAAERALLQAYQASRETVLRRAALASLLERGDRDALAVARERLRTPGDEGLIPLPRAAFALAVHSPPTDAPALRLLAESLDASSEDAEATETAKGGRAAGVADEPARVAAERLGHALSTSRATLDELLSHLDALGQTPDGECAALASRGPSSWVVRRRARLGCAPPRAAVLARLTLPRPGGFGGALLDLVGRLELGSSAHQETFRAGLKILLSRIDEWAGDPVSMTSTGLDLSAPWTLAWWPAADEHPGGAGGGTRLTLRTQDRERAVDTLLRVADGTGDLEGYTRGLLLVEGLPLLPASLLALWDKERSVRAGEGDATSTATPERHVALAAGGSPGEDDPVPTLLEVTVADDGEVRWAATGLAWDGSELSLVTRPEQGPETWEQEPQPPVDELAATLTLDLSAALRRIAEEEGDAGDPAAIPDGLFLRARTDPGGVRLVTRLELTGLSGDWLAPLVEAPVAALRAPAQLLPATTSIWLTATFDPAALATSLAAESSRLGELFGEDGRDKLLAGAAVLRGEAGLAILGVPEPTGDDGPAAWQSRLVGYARVEPAAADRFLVRSMGKAEMLDGLRLHRFADGVALRLGEYLVVAANPAVLRALGRAPFLVENPSFQEITARTPADAALRAGFDTDQLAATLRESAAARGDETATILGIEVLQALGTIAAWARRSANGLVGEVSAVPRLVPEASRPVWEGAHDAGFVRGSVGVDGLGPRAIGDPRQAVELELRLPPGVADPEFAWTHERLSQERLADGAYRFVSRRGVAPPETSPLRLPISGPELLPYLRNEQDLNLHLGALRDQGERIRAALTDPAQIVRAIVTWAHESLEYAVIQRETSVEEILATRRADCSEFTQLTIALARSLGIPARAVSGLHVGDEAAILHRWAEVYLDRWYEVDPTFGVVEVPAENVRIPQVDGAFLANLPQSRLTTRALHGPDGGWSRRIDGVTDAAGRGDTGIAVDGDRVLIVYPGADGASRALLSEDGGAAFRGLVSNGLEGRLVSLLGGHGRLLRVQRLGGEADSIVVYELSSAGPWRRLELPEPLAGVAASGALQLGAAEHGYLALSLAPTVRLFRIDAALAEVTELDLPSTEAGEWLLAPAGEALAHSVPGRGVTVYRRADGVWLPAVPLTDSEGFVARGVYAGDRLAVDVEATTLDGATRVQIVVADGVETRHTLSGGTDAAATTIASGAVWSVGSASSGALVLTRQRW